MSCFLVNFEVSDQSTASAVRAKLKEFKIYCPMTATCWAIVTEKKAAEVVDEIGTVLKSGDRIFVVRSGTEGAWRNSYGSKHSDWLKKHL